MGFHYNYASGFWDSNSHKTGINFDISNLFIVVPRSGGQDGALAIIQMVCGHRTRHLIHDKSALCTGTICEIIYLNIIVFHHFFTFSYSF